MNKTTVYLPDELKRGVEVEAVRRGISEAEVIRQAIRLAVGSRRRAPAAGIFAGTEPIADRVDDLLEGFGAS